MSISTAQAKMIGVASAEIIMSLGTIIKATMGEIDGEGVATGVEVAAVAALCVLLQ